MTTKTENTDKQERQNKRNQFVFFRSFQDAINQCNERDQLALYRAIADYALDETEPSFDNPLLRLAWTLIRPNLNKGLASWKNGCNGGAPIGNQNARKTTEKQPENNQETTQKQRDRIGKDRNGMDNEGGKDAYLSLPLDERKAAFKAEMDQYRGKYESDVLNGFFQYWTEPNKEQIMRFEKEEFFKIKVRLDAWKNRKFD